MTDFRIGRRPQTHGRAGEIPRRELDQKRAEERLKIRKKDDLHSLGQNGRTL
jgi:hypothetical protein